MKRTRLRTIVGFAVGIVAVSAFLRAQAPERFFDTAPVKHGGVRLTVFYPSVGSIRNLTALRKTRALDVPGLVVVGVHHAREATDYTEARAYVRENGIDWFHFHTVSADISEAALFGTNPCTPEYEKIFVASDGIIFFGGPDIPPSIYREKTNLLTIIEDPVRNDFEVSAIFHLLGGFQDPAFKALLESRPDFSILGICLGFQSLNVGTGGTLIQDIWSEVYGKSRVEDVLALDSELWHNNPYALLYPRERLMAQNFHKIRLEEHGIFCLEMGFGPADHPRILSSHHQALEKLGRKLKVAARSMDGKIIEAVTHTDYPNVLGIQFHPENRMLWESEPVQHQAPRDTPFSFMGILEGTPPSAEFNRGIWKWLGQKLTQATGPRD